MKNWYGESQILEVRQAYPHDLGEITPPPTLPGSTHFDTICTTFIQIGFE